MSGIVVKNLFAEYKNFSSQKNFCVLNNINLNVEQGKLLCLSGPNGSGKSTLLGMLAGIKNNNIKIWSEENNCKTEPEIFLDDNLIYSIERKQLSTRIAYLVQNETSVWNYKVKDVVVMGRYCHTNFTGTYSDRDWKVVDEVLDDLNILNYRDKNIFELSGGEWQKVRIARCLAQESDFILLDEPVANLDFEYQSQLLSFIKNYAHEKNIGAVVSIHDLNTASRFADKIVLLSKNKTAGEKNIVIEGSAEEVLTPENLKQIYGGEFGTFVHPEYKCVQVYEK